MSEMFKNYPQPDDYIPNNRPKCCVKSKLEIMCGETAHHTFEIPFNVNEDCSNVKIIYELGLTEVIIKEKKDLDIVISEDNTTIICCTLSNAETTIFSDSLLDKSVQIKFYLKDGSIAYSDIYAINTIDAVDSVPSPAPTPEIIGGIGYEEVD